MTDTAPVLKLADAPTLEGGHGEHFAYTIAVLSRTLGASAIGVNVTRVPAGKAAFPLHHHHANEEHFFILAGRGTLRVGDRTYAVGPNDYVFNPPGDAEHAHQFVNTGNDDLVYLAISTNQVPEVVGYPDSRKTGIRISAANDPGARFLVHDDGPRAQYYDGEDGRTIAALLSAARSEQG